LAVTDYFTYEASIARDHLLPWLQRHQALPAAGQVLDVGCGYGGTLAALKESCPGVTATGLDLDEQMASEGRRRLGPAAEIVHADFFDWSGGPFDLILMRDVLEHIRQPERALARAASMLCPGGWLFASFAPFFGPFGGHQHNGAGIFSAVPWIQLLPAAAFRRLFRVEGNTYKTRSELAEDMDSVLETRLTLSRFLRAAAAANLQMVARASYLSRPDYRIKFGLPALPLPAWAPGHELLATGVEALLRS
jgi:SAM-dependent methyltransferase